MSVHSRKGWYPGALVKFSSLAAYGLVIGVELISTTDEATGYDYISAVIWDYDGTIRKINFAEISAWEPIA